MPKDKDSVGLTTDATKWLAAIEEKGWFSEKADIAKFALAYAIRNGVVDGTTEQAGTVWAAGNFDKTGEIRGLLTVFYPDCETPVRLMEHLVHEGLRSLHERMQTEALTAKDLVNL